MIQIPAFFEFLKAPPIGNVYDRNLVLNIDDFVEVQPKEDCIIMQFTGHLSANNALLWVEKQLDVPNLIVFSTSSSRLGLHLQFDGPEDETQLAFRQMHECISWQKEMKK